MHVLNAFKELFVRISCGNEFHNFDAGWENERSYSAERDLGMNKSPFSDDLKERECFSDKCGSRLEMYVGVKLFRALEVNIAFLYNSRLGTENRPSVSSISLEGVIKSAFNIIRAARFFKLESHSIFELDKFP